MGRDDTVKAGLMFTFPTEEMRERFLVYMSDGGGEYGFMMSEDFASIGFDYKGAFKAWGWDGTGIPLVKVFIHEEE